MRYSSLLIPFLLIIISRLLSFNETFNKLHHFRKSTKRSRFKKIQKGANISFQSCKLLNKIFNVRRNKIEGRDGLKIRFAHFCYR